MQLPPMNELAAVNHILENMGEAPVLTLEGDDIPLDALKARSTLRMVKDQVLSRGWYWNIEAREMTPDSEGHIEVPEDVLAVRPVDRLGYSLTVRNGRLYRIQPYNNGDTFEGAVRVHATVTLPFDDLPPHGRFFVSRKAAREYQVQELGNDALTGQNTEEEARSWSELVADDNRARPSSLAHSQDLMSILGRNRRNPRL